MSSIAANFPPHVVDISYFQISNFHKQRTSIIAFVKLIWEVWESLQYVCQSVWDANAGLNLHTGP